MTFLYLVAVGFIYVCTSIAWLTLSVVTDMRTHDKDGQLRGEVGHLWGEAHHQVPPTVTLAATPAELPTKPKPTAAEDDAAPNVGKGEDVAPASKESEVPKPCLVEQRLDPVATRATADLDLQHRRKGLLWYATYDVRFDGTFTMRNTSPCEREAVVWLPFPSSGATYDDFALEVDGGDVAYELINGPVDSSNTHRGETFNERGAAALVVVQPNSEVNVRVRYASRGMDSWTYSLGSDTSRAKDFELTVNTTFDGFDFPGHALSPSSKEATDAGWALTWKFDNLLADAPIAVAMPHKLNPGPLTTEISRFAPVSLFFFFFVLLLVSVVKQVRLHPVHFGLLAGAFFSFHLLTAYLVDHVSIFVAIGISSLTSVGLVVSYLRLVAGSKFAVLWAGGAQLLYLVLFSLAFFVEGYTGLTITVFSVLTLFLVMQLTARIDWSTKFGRAGGKMHVGGLPTHRAAAATYAASPVTTRVE